MRFIGVLLLLAASGALAADIPLAGKRLQMRSRSGATGRRLRIELRDVGLAAPFPDLGASGARLVIHGGSAAGHCFTEATFDAPGWTPIGDDGPGRGWKWTGPQAGSAGVYRLVVRPGRLLALARGSAWPCGLEAAQRTPVTITLATAGTRWCGAFGGVTTNRPGRFVAHDAPAPAACPSDRLTVATLNILHGLFCSEPTPDQKCRFSDRLALLGQWIVARGCPDVVTLQEIWQAQAPLVASQLSTICPSPYEVTYIPTNLVDDAIVLSRYPITTAVVQRLYVNFRHVVHVRLDHPLGPLDVLTTHLASGSDGAQLACGSVGTPCPTECVAAGATTVRECQAVQLAEYATTAHGTLSTPAVVTGDFNVPPGTFAYAQLAARGWSDTYLAAGNPECVPATGVGCTSGRNDEDLLHMEDPASNETERIDYVFAIPSTERTCVLDADGTRLFADEPNPFGAACGPAPAPICWPSDHVGSQAELRCQ